MSAVPKTDTRNDALDRTKAPFLRRVRISGYKSIAFCDVALEPLTILVGRNASGKSNFLDALAFLRDCANHGVPEAIQRRGNMQSLLCRSGESNALTFEIETRFTAGPNHTEHQALYRLNIPAVHAAGFLTHGEPEEWGTIKELATGWQSSLASLGPPPKELRVFSGPIEMGTNVTTTTRAPWSIASGQLMFNYLAQPPYAEWADYLRRMTFYNFVPKDMRPPQRPNPEQMLDQNGWNLASVLDSTRRNDDWAFQRVASYLSAVVPEVERFDRVQYGEYETVHFWLSANGAGKKMDFDAASMSDGTLRVLAALTAAFQSVLRHGCPSLVGIEEPETALHPAAMRALVDALEDATQRTQILVTTHSADLLSGRDVSPGQVLVVRKRGGQTYITPVDPASREIVQKELYSLAELQRMDKLDLDEADLKRQTQLSPLGKD